MRLETAQALLRRPVGASRRRRRALGTVVLLADGGQRAAVDALARVVPVQGSDVVWRVWLELPGRRWDSPVVRALEEQAAEVTWRAVDAAWQDWLDGGGREVWQLLDGWRCAASDADPARQALSRLALGEAEARLDPELLVRAAVRFDHPVGGAARARLLADGDQAAVDLFCEAAVDSRPAVAFCVEHRLAPREETRRAVFFLRTGQYPQYQALDPDGTLLGLGYRGASAEERARLRAAMARHVDVVRVLAGQRTRSEDLGSLSEDERGYLVRQLAARARWAELWRLVLALPVGEAAQAVRMFNGWQPPEEDRPVFRALLAADPASVRLDLERLRDPAAAMAEPHLRIRLRDIGAVPAAIQHMDFSPDGRQLAFSSWSFHDQVGILDPAGRSLLRYRKLSQTGTMAVHLGADTVVAAHPRGVRLLTGDQEPEDRTGEVGSAEDLSFRVLSVQRVAGDRAFVIGCWGGRPHQGRVFLSRGGAPLRDTGVLDGLPLRPNTLAVGPDGSRIAVLDHRHAVVADLEVGAADELGPVPEPVGKRVRSYAALSPRALVRTTAAGDLHVWHAPFTGRRPPAAARPWSRGSAPVGVVWSPLLERFLAVTQYHLEVLDIPPDGGRPVPGDPVAERIPLTRQPFARRCVRLSPDGSTLALATEAVDLYTAALLALRDILPRPVRDLDRTALATVVAALESPALPAELEPTLELLRTCLEHRFRHDVELGDGSFTVVGDDIALGGAEPAGTELCDTAPPDPAYDPAPPGADRREEQR